MSKLFFVLVFGFGFGLISGMFLTKARRAAMAAFIRRMIWPFKARYIRNRTFAKVKKLKRKILLLNFNRSFMDVNSKKYKKIFSKEQKMQLQLYRLERRLERQNHWIAELK